MKPFARFHHFDRLTGWAVGALLIAALAALQSACSSSANLPPIKLVRLAPQPGEASRAPSAQPPSMAASSAVWQLVAPITLPGYLDRDALLVPQGQAGLAPLAGYRWAEPLRDAVPRVLSLDLSRAMNTPLWMAPLPAGTRPTHQLRVQLVALDVLPDRSGVAVAARWSVADPSGQRAPQLGHTEFTTPSQGSDGDALAAAHRLALAELAQRMAAQLSAASAP